MDKGFQQITKKRLKKNLLTITPFLSDQFFFVAKNPCPYPQVKKKCE